MNKKLLAIAAAGLLAGPIMATAMPVTYDFTVNGGASGPLAGVSSAGFFSFDDSIIPAGGGIVGQDDLLTDLAFTWNGLTYDETNANTGGLVFDADGVLTNALFGTHCGFGGCTAGISKPNSWLVVVGQFHYDTAGGGLHIGSFAYSRRASVPEPGTLALFGLGMMGLGLTRRRRAA